MSVFNYPNTNAHEINLDWIVATIKELDKIIEDFTALNKLTWKGEWDIQKFYPKWSLVSDNGNGYLSIKPVPRNVAIDNTEYWVLVANYDALYSAFEQRISALETTVTSINSSIDSLNTRIEETEESITDIESEIDSLEFLPVFNVLKHGVVADGLTDASAKINELYAEGHTSLYFPEGVYYIKDESIIFDKPHSKIYGDGPETIFKLDKTVSMTNRFSEICNIDFVCNTNNIVGLYVENTYNKVHDINLYDSDNACFTTSLELGSSGHGIWFCYINNIGINSTANTTRNGVGIKLTSSVNNLLSNIKIEYKDIGVKFTMIEFRDILLMVVKS